MLHLFWNNKSFLVWIRSVLQKVKPGMEPKAWSGILTFPTLNIFKKLKTKNKNEKHNEIRVILVKQMIELGIVIIAKINLTQTMIILYCNASATATVLPW